MDVQRQQVVEAFPDLDAVPAGPQWAFALRRAKTIVGDRFGEDSDMAVMLYTAHLIQLGRGAASGRGAVTSETVGSVSRTYASPEAGSSGVGLRGTSYGAQFLSIAGMHTGPLLLST